MQTTMPRHTDRLEYERLPLHLPLQFAREGRSERVECVTECISGNELCFISPELLQPGERMDVDVLLLANKLGRDALNVHLKCRVDVERVDATRSDSGFRIGCRIRKYGIGFGNTDLGRDHGLQESLPIDRIV